MRRVAVRAGLFGALAGLVTSMVSVVGFPVGAAGAASAPPSGQAAGTPAPVPVGFAPGVSVEVPGARSEFNRAYTNPDGSRTLVASTAPQSYQGPDGTWMPIDTSVVADPAVAGGLRTRADSWVAHFEPLPAGLVVDTPTGRHLTFAPAGAAAMAPKATADGQGVVYANAWPGADLVYEASALGVKESIVLHQRPVSSSFAFSTGPVGFTPSTDGGMTTTSTVAAGLRLLPPVVLNAQNRPVGAAHPTLAGSGPASANQVSVSVDPTWLAGLTSADYPVTIDPSFTWGSSNLTSYDSNGSSPAPCTNCGLRVGNDQGAAGGADRFWRSVGLFDYSSIDGTYVSAASIKLYNLDPNSAPFSYNISAYHASAYSYAGAKSGSALATDPSGTSDTLTSTTLTNTYHTWVANSTNGAAIGLVGLEAAGQFSFQQFDAYTLTLTYYHYPGSPAGRSVTPCSAVCHTQPVITNSAKPTVTGGTTNADGLAMNYTFQIWDGVSASPTVEAAAGTVSNVASGATASWTDTTALANGSSYEYRVQACITADTAVCGAWSSGWMTFTVDTAAPAAPTISSSTEPSSTTWYNSTNNPSYCGSSSCSFTGTWTATDPSGITGYAVVLDNTATTVPAATVTQTTASYSHTVGSGTWYLHVRAEDNAGNWSTTATYLFHVETSTANWETPATGTVASGTANLEVQSGPDATSATFQYSYAGGSWQTLATVGSHDASYNWTTSWNTAATGGGTRLYPNGPYLLGVQLQYSSGPGPLTQGPVVWVGDGPVQTGEMHGGDNPSDTAVSQPATKLVDPAIHGSVDDATGELSVSVGDSQFAGFGLPLDLTRTYNSFNAGSLGPFGYGWTDSYNMTVTADPTYGAAVEDVTQENGSIVRFTQDGTGTWTPPSRVNATLVHLANGSWTFVRAGQTTFGFNSAGQLTSETDLNNHTTTLTYTAGQLTAVTDPSGLTIGFGWGTCATSSCVTTVTDPAGRVIHYGYDTNANLTSVQDVAGNTVHYDYNPSHEMTSLTDADGNNTTVGYTANQATSETDPSNHSTTWAYSLDGAGNGTTTVTDPLNNQTQYTFAIGELTSETDAAGSSAATTTTYTYDPATDGPTTKTTAAGTPQAETTAYSYNSNGETTSATDPLGQTVYGTYNGNNLQWCQVDAADYANGTRCPASPPAAPPSPGVADPNPGMTINFYSPTALLTATTDALGNTTTYAYTTGLSGIPDGLQYCSVDPVDYQDNVVCPAYGAAHVTGTTTQTFDSTGDKTSATDADGNTTTYTYGVSGHPGLVGTQTDPDGALTSYSYNPTGQVISKTVSFSSYSATTLNAYDASGNQYCQVDPNQAAQGVVCPTTPPATAPTPSSDPYLGATITTYDNDGRAVQTTNPLGGITYTGYDFSGNSFCTVAPDQAAAGVTCPSSPPSNPPTIGNDPYLGATLTTYDAQNRAVQVTNPLGGITLTAYDNNGQVTQTTVKSNNPTADPDVITDNTYDAAGRVTSSTVDPGTTLAQTTLQSYDPNGNVYCKVSAKASAAGSSTYQCPPWQATWITTPPNPATLYSANPTATQANNVTTAFDNSNGQQIQTTNADLDTTVTAIDGDRRTYCSADPTNVAVYLNAHPSATYPYLCPSTPPAAPPGPGSNPGYTTSTYDSAGHTLSTTDQIGDTTSYTYTPGGQVLAVTDPRGQITTNCYYFQSASGECAQAAPAAGGSADDLYSTTTPPTEADPSGETTTTTYHPGGQLNSKATPAGITTDTYDANGDLTSSTYTNTATGYATPTNLSYAYNVDGTKHSATDATGTTTYAYDPNGDLASATLVAAGPLANATVTHSYYSTGVQASTTYPSYAGHTNPTVTYAYDATGAMISETDWLGNTVTMAHDPDGNTTSQDNNVTLANPTGTSATTFNYDNADNNTQATSAVAQTCGGNETLTQSFAGAGGSRNPDGQVTQDSEAYSGSCSGQTNDDRYYNYDPAGRVTYQGTSSQGASPDTFAYDQAGDPTTISNHDTAGDFDTYAQTFDPAGALTSQSPVNGSNGATTTYTYDTLGDLSQSMTGTDTSTYTYDQVGDMTAATTTSGAATYLYNGAGLESAAITSGQIGQFTWNTADDQLALILSDSTNDYIYGSSSQPVEQIALSTSAPTYLTYTPSDDAWLSTNQNGDETGYWRYDAYGSLEYGTPTSAFGYSGQFTDSITGLVNDRARWYQPGPGEFTTRDPLFSQTDTAYTYADDDPVNETDPTGALGFPDPIYHSFRGTPYGFGMWNWDWYGHDRYADTFSLQIVFPEHPWQPYALDWGILLSQEIRASIGTQVFCRCRNFRYGRKTNWGPYNKDQYAGYWWHSEIRKLDHPWVPYQLSCQWNWLDRYTRGLDWLQMWFNYQVVDPK